MPIPGADVFIVDDPLGGDAAGATDTFYLLSLNGPATPTVKLRADTGNVALDAQLRAYFADGGKAVVIQGYGDGDPLPTLTDALAMLPAGPGQVVAPEVVASADLIDLVEGAWAQNKVALLSGPVGANDAALTTLAAAVIAGTDARAGGLWADELIYPAETPGDTNIVPSTVAVAAMIARADRITGNPNTAPAGVRGRSTALGISNERTDAERTALTDAQVNTFKTVSGQVRNYGFRTLSDLDMLPHWWDLSGTRTVMAFRARAAGIDEDILFDQIDPNRVLLDRYEGLLRSALKDLYDKGALFGATPDDAYSVDTSDGVNPPEDLAVGKVAATVRMKVSPYAEHVTTTIVRRPIAAAL